MEQIVIKLFEYTGVFAENKDIAREIRKNRILPALKDGKNIILDFSDVEFATQSFMHALISDAIRNFGEKALDRLFFKDCNDSVQKIVRIVTEYMQRTYTN